MVPEPQALVATRTGPLGSSGAFAALLAAGGVLLAGRGVLHLVGLGSDRTTLSVVLSVAMTLGGLLFAAGFGSMLLRRPTDQLRVAADGLTYSTRRTSLSWTWDEITSLRLTGGVFRSLAIKGGADRPSPTRVLVARMDPDVLAIVSSVHACSGGRFPDPV